MTDIETTDPEPQRVDIPEVERAGNTTVSKAIVDIDALIAGDIERATAAIGELEEVRISLFGQEWRLVDPTNSFTSFRAANLELNPDALVRALVSMVHPDEQPDFEREIQQQRVLPSDALIKIWQAFAEALGRRPTERSSSSGRTRQTRRR